MKEKRNEDFGMKIENRKEIGKKLEGTRINEK